MPDVSEDDLRTFLNSDNADGTIFLRLFEGFKPGLKEKAFDWLDDSDMQTFWKRVFDLTKCHTMTLLSKTTDLVSQCSVNDTETEQNLAFSREVVQAVIRMMIVACSLKKFKTQDGFVKSIVMILDLFPNLALAGCEEDLEIEVLELSEQAWKWGLSKQLASSTMNRLITLTLLPKATKNSVTRLWNMQECLSVALQLENKKEVASKLEKCFTSKIFFECKQGVAFLSWALAQHGMQLQAVHRDVKDQLYTCSSLKQAEAYGQVYFKAWMAASKVIRKNIEEFLSDIIKTTLHYNRKKIPSIFGHFCKFLNAFHQKRNNTEVATLLTNIYNPVIWRNLKVSNYIVRGNAAHLLFDVFPLVSADKKIEQEHSLITQCNEMELLLKDPVPEVRCTAALGMFNCLKTAWENLPSEVIRKWLGVLLGPCLHDGNSAELRYTVVKGLSGLTDNPLCHETLKALLPKIKNSFHDVSEKVREAFLLLLKKINCLEGFKYWEVVPVEQLLARIKDDPFTICELIVKLSHKNLLPPNKPENLMLERSFYLFKTNISASRIYVRHWCLLTELELVVSFMKLWNKSMLDFVLQSTMSGNDSFLSEDVNASGIDVPTENEQESSIGDPVILCGIADSLCVCWKTIQKHLEMPENKVLHKDLLIAFEASLPKILLFFRNGPEFIWTPLLLFASSLRLASLKPHLAMSASKIQKLEDDSIEGEEQILALVGSLLYQGAANQLLELVVDWLDRSFQIQANNRCSLNLSMRSHKNKQPRKHVHFEEKPAKPKLALSILSLIIKYPELQAILLAECDVCVEKELLPVLARVKSVIEDSFYGKENNISVSKDLLVQAFSLYCHIVILLNKEGQEFDTVSAMENLLLWIKATLGPHLGLSTEAVPDQPSGNSEESGSGESGHKPKSTRKATKSGRGKGRPCEPQLPLAVELTKVFLQCSSDVILLGLYNKNFLASFCTILCQLIKTGNGGYFLAVGCRCLCVLTDRVIMNEVLPSDESISILSSLVSSIIWKVGSSFTNDTEEEASKGLRTCAKPMGQCLSSLFQNFSGSNYMVAQLIAILFSSVMGNISHVILKMELEEVSQLKEPPALTKLILTNWIGKEQMFLLLESLTNYLDTIQPPLQILAFGCSLYYIMDIIGKQQLLKDVNVKSTITDLVNGANRKLITISHQVKNQHEGNENMHSIPEVIYCKCCQKLLKEVVEKIS